MTATGDARTGVIVMSYGSPATSHDLEAYYTHIRHGRPPTAEQLDTLRARYDAIGGASTLAARTTTQRAALQRALDATEPDRYVVVAGDKHAPPFIEDGVATLAEAGLRDAVGVVLAPHWSAASVGEYQARAVEAATAAGIEMHAVNQWHLLPELVAFNGAGVRAALDGIGTPEASTKVVFTAHSLPERALVDDPLPEQLWTSARAAALAAGVHRWAGWSIAWQSASATPEPWRGPDVGAVIRDLADTGRATGVVVCPHGFTSDHLEVAYDLDTLAASIAEEVGLAFARTAVVNDDAHVLGALAAKIASVADGADDPVMR